MNCFLLLNPKEDIFKNVGNQREKSTIKVNGVPSTEERNSYRFETT